MTESTFKTLLHSVGIYQHYRGYTYLLESVELASREPHRLHNIQKELYLPIAEKYQTNVQNVEKDIRTVRNILIRNGGEEMLSELTGFPFCGNRHPYPKEIIGIFSEYLRNEARRAKAV